MAGNERFPCKCILAPVWDYSKIPGTTARQEENAALMEHGDWHVTFRPECCCEGKTEGNAGTRLCMDVKHVTGSWQRNNLSAPKDPVTETLFTLTIPYEGQASYAYMVSAREAHQTVEILRNDGVWQAILVNGETLMAVFHEKAELDARGAVMHGKAGQILIRALG